MGVFKVRCCFFVGGRGLRVVIFSVSVFVRDFAHEGSGV